MISKIQGKVRSKKQGKVLLEVAGGISYEVLVPDAVMRSIEKDSPDGSDISLTTYYYFQSDPSKSIPVLIGFLNEIEKEFFEKFITVSGVGPKAACRALTLPFSEIAAAIDRADLAVLKSLPGIGEQRAKEIIAKLQGKVGKFGLIRDKGMLKPSQVKENVRQEAMGVLLQLQYKRKEAEHMLESAIRRNPKAKTSEELLNEVYRQKTKE